MNGKIKVDGVYDQRTLKVLAKYGINDISFDFRPKSFNFLQEHIFLELMDQFFDSEKNYYLHFSGETDFIVQRILNDLKQVVAGKPVAGELGNFCLEFSDCRPVEFYEQFKMPFYWHYTPDFNFAPLLGSKYLQGIFINFKTIEHLHREGRLGSFVQSFHQMVYSFPRDEDIKLGLIYDWDSDIFPSVLEYFDFDLWVLPINSKVELCYRNVDVNKFTDSLNHCLKEIE